MNLFDDIDFAERFLEIYLQLEKGTLKGKVSICEQTENSVKFLVDDKYIEISIKK